MLRPSKLPCPLFPGHFLNDPGPAGTGPQFLRNLEVVSEKPTGDLRTTYGDTFIVIFPAIKARLVHIFFHTLDLNTLLNAPLAYLWGLWECWKGSDGSWPSQAVGYLFGGSSMLFDCSNHTLLEYHAG